MSAHPESAYCIVGAAQNAAAERRAPPSEPQRRTAPTRALAGGKHALRRAAWATPRTTGVRSHSEGGLGVAFRLLRRSRTFDGNSPIAARAVHSLG